MKKLLGHVLALLLTVALSASVLLWTIGNTLAKPSFLEHIATQTQLYDHLAASIPGTDPAAIRYSLDSALPQIIDYATNGGPSPSINVPGNPDGPITLAPASPQLVAAAQNLRKIAFLAPVAALVLTLIIVVVMGHLRWRTLARGALGSAVGLGLSAAVFWLSPAIISQNALKSVSIPVKAAFEPFITATFHALATYLGAGALALVGIAGMLIAAHMLVRIMHRLVRPHRSAEPTPLPPPYGPGRS